MELKYLDRAELCAEAQAVVRRVYSEMSGKSDFIALCEHIDKGGSFTELRRMIDECAEKHGQNVYELRNTVYMASLESARKNYIKNGIEEMFFEGLSDFGTKTEECFKVCGVYGSRSVEWFAAFFTGERYTFGRLQYQSSPFWYEDYERDGVVLKVHEPVWNIHIPSRGKLTPESVEESLKAAYKGLPRREDGKQAFVCSTWFFYPAYQGTVFPVGSNIYKFAQLFDIISVADSETFKDCWRIFSVEQITDIDALPQETSIQRRFVEYLRAGGKCGTAAGVVLLDENGII